MKYQLLIAYDGTHYGGWQIQPNASTIQELIQKALTVALRKQTHATGSGRTDAGVHARGQIAHFEIKERIDVFHLKASLNALLPTDIRILNIKPVNANFHARYSAIGKIYHYHLHLESFLDPFKRLYSTHVPYPIDLQLLKESASYFLGTHDFTSFTNEAHRGSASKNPVKTLTRLDIVEEDGGIRLEFEADGFLYKMVRNIVGTLLEVAAQKRHPEQIPPLFELKDRRKAGQTAPPTGLFLHQVLYRPLAEL